ncbi:uncharacterized protein LAESUDRAFT_285947 [Laetiporus sulphureus 93-53]|uniref:DNA-directed RNA polymerase subunit n=1 Tax=Laetiporus sulphureus 93-53 TaxID=1314785 RepID=A0A165DGS4_9APHY|nr:uncharacterized protein LAESUDRAFT_285947 [Laetiporus sulphureus 93-53]KZT04846.1 hypothetical protein LAESUDRAFT_285947 [Laetiporus sulphureus 93-53]
MASLHFCSECNNLLYPKADQQRRIMVYACRICNYDEIGENKCVYRNDLLTVTKEQVGVTTDLMNDPTLAHANMECPSCHHNECVSSSVLTEIFCLFGVAHRWRTLHSAVYFQDQSKRKETRMILFYVCTRCNHEYTDPTVSRQDIDT